MNRLRTVLSFFALPAAEQIQLVPEVPFDRGAADYYTALDQNPLAVLLRGLAEDYSQPELEPDAEYRARTGLDPGHACGVLNELSSYIYLLRQHYHADDYWTQRALASKDEWRLVRRLANLALAENGWAAACNADEVREACQSLKRQFANPDS